MIIEFFGLPGSGKTVNLKELLRRYGSDACQIVPDHKALKNVRSVFSAEFFAFLFKLLRLWLWKKHKVRYDFRALYYFCLLYLTYMNLRKEHGKRYYLFDHGWVQSVSSLVWDEPALYEKCGAIFQHLNRYFNGAICFVFTDHADEDVLVERIKTRTYDVRLKHFSAEEAKRVLHAQRRFFVSAAAELKKGFSVLPLDSGQPLPENTERICRAIENRDEK